MVKNLTERTARGAVARVGAQFANFALRLTSLSILARLLTPDDFGLVGMVTALTGVLVLFRDFGLSAATVQRATVTEAQTTALFWLNVLFGTALTALMAGLAPVIAAFYHEPRLFWVVVIIGSTFCINAAGIQHSALLQRQLRFTTLSVIDTGSWVLSTSVAIGMAKAGFGYWALVAMSVSLPLTATTALWIVSGWRPGMLRRGAGIASLLRFGGTITLNGLIVYIALNFEKVLLGRFWGADAIGIYGRAYQLIRIPTDTINGAIGEVAFSALSRLQNDAMRLRSYFLKGYSLVLGLTLPATFACGIFADDLIALLLGPKWKDAVPIFRLLTPTILVFAMANPLGWLLGAIGLVQRGVKMALVLAPLLIGGYFVGLPYGPKGVAIAYSTVMVLWLVPGTLWSVQGTVVSFADVALAASRPLMSGVVAGALAIGVCLFGGESHLARLIFGGTALIGGYITMLFYAMGQRTFYLDLIRNMIRRPPAEETALASP